MVPLSTTTKGGRKNLTAFWKIDVLPAKEAGIDGPGARSYHRQSRAQGSQYGGNPGIARMRGIPRDSDPYLNDGCQRSCHWSPQTDEKKYPHSGSNDLEHGRRQRGCFKQAGDREVDERGRGKQPQKKKTYAWPTASERRE